MADYTMPDDEKRLYVYAYSVAAEEEGFGTERNDGIYSTDTPIITSIDYYVFKETLAGIVKLHPGEFAITSFTLIAWPGMLQKIAQAEKN